MLSYYAPTFLDESLSHPDKKGQQYATGRRSGMIFVRTFSKSRSGFKARRLVISFSWDDDSAEAKATALAKVIDGMEEMPELDKNPPLNWIPKFIKEKLMKFPKKLYVKVCDDGSGNEYFGPHRAVDTLADAGVKVRVGVYELSSVIEARGSVSVVTTNRVKRV